MGKEVRDLLSKGDRVEGRWLVKQKLGRGGFGQVYAVMDEKKETEVAMKVEPTGTKATIPAEAIILRKINGKPHFPTYYGHGGNSTFHYLVMEVLGKNLSALRRESPGDRACFSRRTAYALGIQCLEAIQDFHLSGFLHRDVKPGNFVMGKVGSPKQSVVFIIDYGLARALFDKNKNLKPPRPPKGFRGTVKFASPAAHDCEDLGRKDDLWCHFYMILEMARGSLPWRRFRNKNDVAHCKKTITMERLCSHLPTCLIDYGNMLKAMTYETLPPYAAIRAILEGLLQDALLASPEVLVSATASRTPMHRSFPLDWEEGWLTLRLEHAEHVSVARTPSAGTMATATGAATGKTSKLAASADCLPALRSHPRRRDDGSATTMLSTKSTKSFQDSKCHKLPKAPKSRKHNR